MSVKGGKSIVKVLALVSRLITTENLKSSIALYSVSSTIRGSLWISSMKRMSPPSLFKLDKIAPKSPGFSKAGPLTK